MILKAAYQKPQGMLLKLTLENLEIYGNFVFEIGWSPCNNEDYSKPSLYSQPNLK